MSDPPSDIPMKLNAIHYQAHSNTQKCLARSLLAHYEIKADEIVLDIGCGDGTLSAEIAALAPQGKVMGIDPSPDMIQFAQQNYANNAPHLQFQIGQAEDQHIANTYSLITAFSCLHWVRDLTSAFSHIQQVLKPGGHMLGLMFPAESVYWQPFIKTLQQPQWRTYFPTSIATAWCTSDQIKTIVQQAGLDIEYWSVTETTASYETVQDFANYVMGWLPCLLPVDSNTLAEFLAEVIHHTTLHYKQGDGLSLPYTQLNMVLTKPE